MRRLPLALLPLASLAVACGPACAADRPPIIPLRDVDVLYQVVQPVPGGPALAQRMRWSVATGRLRVDPPSAGLYMIVDYRTKRMAVVKDEQHAVLDVSTAGPGLPGAAAGSYTRQDAAEIAGLRCTNWLTADAGGKDTTLCLTEDGVMLRASQSGQVLLQATAVRYGPQDAAAFTPPEGYRHVSGDRP